jgi:dipeptidyl aminopeptidase/acylaminoacyl peptidase
VQCWLMLPKGQGPHPLALEIHGGPYAQYGARFSIKYQMLAAAGYAVLFTNPAGSTGYGEAFANVLHDRFPGPDYDDLMAAVDAASARPEIDARNLFITGTSGGGVLTLWTVTHTHRFRAAVAIKPVVDWQSWVLSADVGPSIGRRWMGHDLPWEAHEKYRERSPLSHAQHAKTPTLLMAGESDSRTPISETLQMYAALKLAGCEAELLRFPGTAHSTNTMRPSLFAAEVAATIGWFDRFRG